MKNFISGLIGFGIGMVVLVLFYYFQHLPAIDESYKKGLSECTQDTDTLYLPGKDMIVYRDTSFHKTTPVEIKEETDSSFTIYSLCDTCFVSGKDTICATERVDITMQRINNKWDIENSFAEWFSTFEHRDFVETPDTVEIFTPKYIEKIVTETDWLMTGIAYVGGVISAILIFFTAK